MESMVDADPEPPPAPPLPPVPLADLILSLEQATQMAKQLPATAADDPVHLLHIYSSLHQAYHHLSNFLSAPHQTPPPQRQTSLSSATGNEPMEVGDVGGDCDEGGNSEAMVDVIEEQMKDCFIKNKRPKRRLSPSAAAVAEEKRVSGGDGDGGLKDYFDAHESKLRALELVYQFHG